MAFCFVTQTLAQTSSPDGRVTRIVHDVQVMAPQAAARPAVIDDKLTEGNGLRTGADSRSELTFADLTITRLGENTIFSFNKAGRQVQLDSGSVLLCVPKNSGGAQITAPAVTVGVTGTTLILESGSGGDSKLLVLEGAVRLSLNDSLGESSTIQGGQMLTVPGRARKIPAPVHVNIADVLKNHPLIKDFPPLPSADLIAAVAEGQNAAVVAPAKPGHHHGHAPVSTQNGVAVAPPQTWPGYPTTGTVVKPWPNPTPGRPKHPRPTPTRPPISSGSGGSSGSGSSGGSYNGPSRPRPRPTATPRKYQPTPTPKPVIY